MTQARFFVSTAFATTLPSGCGSSDTTLTVAAMPGTWPTQFPYPILLEWGTTSQEVALVTGAPTGGGPFVIPVTRGVDGTTAQVHGSGAEVVHGVSAEDFNQPAAFLGNWYYLDSYSGTDDQKMAAALTALFAASPAGGTIVLAARAHSFANQWATTYSAGVATAVKIQGQGAAFNGAWGTPSAATTCTFTYAGGGAAMCDFQHIGTIEITGLQLKQANTGKPFILTTNATPDIHDCVLSGGGTGTSCVTDAIICGGTGASVGAGDTAPYQGYAGSIRRNFFDGIRRAVRIQTFGNAIQVTGNTISANCGNGALNGECIQLNGGSSTCTGNVIRDNCIEMVHYQVGVKCLNLSFTNTLGPNGFFDAVSVSGYYYFDTTSEFNDVIDGMRTDTFPLMLDLSGQNSSHTSHQAQVSYHASYEQYRYNITGAQLPSGTVPGFASISNFGDQAGMLAVFPGQAAVWAAPATFTSDGAVTSGSGIVTSATAHFTAADVGEIILCGTILSWIQAVFTPVTAWPWQASAAYSAGDIARPVSGNSHLYQATAGGTSGSSQPTWPTSGGTVTDGTVTWKDLGTATTAALAGGAATGSATAQVLAWGRLGTPKTMTAFASHHILSSGSAPAAAPGAAGVAGTGATATIAGTDLAHTLTLTTGTGTLAAGVAATVTFSLPYATAPRLSLTAANANAPAVLSLLYATKTTTTYTLTATAALTASTAYVFDVHTIQ